eukprot:629320-Amphidinium_carterae.2
MCARIRIQPRISRACAAASLASMCACKSSCRLLCVCGPCTKRRAPDCLRLNRKYLISQEQSSHMVSIQQSRRKLAENPYTPDAGLVALLCSPFVRPPKPK